jgi:hypothetical protein
MVAICFRLRRAGIIGGRVRRVLKVQVEWVVFVLLLVMVHLRSTAAGLAIIVVRHKLRERDVGRASDGTGARRREHAEIPTPGAPVLGVQCVLSASYVVR